jgi:hypothetical protein
MFTAVLKRARHLFGARLIQSMAFIQIFKIRFNIILISMPRSSKWTLSFPHQNPVCTCLPSKHATCCACPFTCYPNNTCWEVRHHSRIEVIGNNTRARDLSFSQRLLKSSAMWHHVIRRVDDVWKDLNAINNKCHVLELLRHAHIC